jgi:hypothetical protein
MRALNTLVVGILLAIAAPGLHAQTAGGGGAQGVSPAAAKAPARAAKGPAKGPGKAKGKPAVTAAAAPKAPAGAEAAVPADSGDVQAGPEAKFARRDPFESLINRQESGPAKNLPPGKAGLQVSTLRLDGIVKSSNGMIAVVSNPQSRTYFLREGDQLYDGRVEKIAMDGVAFHEIGKDAFGKPVERQVNKRIYASAGEQQ